MVLLASIVAATIALLPKEPGMYAKEHWDVVFFGTSQCYASFEPAVFDEYGLETFNRGRQQQPMSYTYYYVKDALEHCDIDTIVVETYAMSYPEGHYTFTDPIVRDSSFNDFPYSETKVEMIKECLPEELHFEYLFPLDKYHSNWENLDTSSPIALCKDLVTRYKDEPERGFFGWEESVAAPYEPEEKIFSIYQAPVYKENFNYLIKIYELCKEYDTRLVLVKGPFTCDGDQIGVTNSVFDWAKTRKIECINYMKLARTIGIDFATDSCDAGVHLSISGAKKVSHHLAKYLTGEIELEYPDVTPEE